MKYKLKYAIVIPENDNNNNDNNDNINIKNDNSHSNNNHDNNNNDTWDLRNSSINLLHLIFYNFKMLVFIF